MYFDNRKKGQMMDWYNEPNPFYREIYGLGFDIITEDIPMQELVLTRLKDKFTTRIPIPNLGHPYTIKVGILPDGNTHLWIAESDGSAEQFRNTIPLQKGGND